MALMLELPRDYPIDNLPDTIDVPSLIREQRWDELEAVPVCIDSYGKVTAHFGQDVWDCTPYSVGKGTTNNQKIFSFTFLNEIPELKNQAKTIVFGWLYHAGHYTGKRSKLVTVCARFNKELKRTLSFLLAQDIQSLSDLSHDDVWGAYLEYLESRQLSFSTLEKNFIALTATEHLRGWLPFSFELPNTNWRQLCFSLAPSDKHEPRQYLAIPQSIADLIYGEAVSLVEKTWPHRDLLTQLERDIQTNFDDNHPETYASIICRHLSDTDLLPIGPVDGLWFTNWFNRLKDACFICCGGFTGMRNSELFELHPDSFFTRQIDGQTFPVVRGAHLKLIKGGKKHEEWLASPVVEKAISLVTAITTPLRDRLITLANESQVNGDIGEADQYLSDAKCLWLSNGKRSSNPTVILRGKWGERLTKFAESVNAVITEDALDECRRLNPRDNGAIDELSVGDVWPVSPHQFRRTFAVFAVRNHLGHPIAIKQQFKHLYLRMSEWYGNGAAVTKAEDAIMDTELQQLIDDANAEHIATEYNRWYNTDETIAGGYGKAIVAMRDDRPVIYSSWDKLYRLVKDGRLTLHGTLHSYCKNGYKCDMDGVVNPAFCTDCSSSVIDQEKAQWWQKRHQALTQHLANQTSPGVGEYAHFITQIRAAENVMRDFDLLFEPYKHPVEVISL